MNVFDPIIKNLGIDWKIFLAQLVNFGIVFFVLKKFAFSPIQKLLKERQNKIEKGLNDAKRAASELNMAKEKYQEEIRKAKTEANKIVGEAQKLHDNIIERADEESQKKIEQSMEKAKKEIHSKKEQTMAEIKEETIELSIFAAERFLREKFDAKQNKNFIEKIIKIKQ
jgi:F-type H+-transporting ATPase subunit b